MEELIIESPDVALTTPVYNVTRIKLISGRIPNCQLLVNRYNNAFEHLGNAYEIPVGTYATGQALSDAFNASGSPVTSSFDPNTNVLTFSEDFTPLTPWLADILGYPSGGPVDLGGTRYITLKITIGKDVLSQKVITKHTDCHYAGKILTGPLGEMIRYTDTLDSVELRTKVSSIQTMRVDLLNPDGSEYDFGGQPWVLKFHVECSTDKLSVSSKPELPKSMIEAIVSQPDDNQKFILLAALLMLSFGLLMLLTA